MKRKKWLNVILEEFVKLNNYGKIKNRHCCSVNFFLLDQNIQQKYLSK